MGPIHTITAPSQHPSHNNNQSSTDSINHINSYHPWTNPQPHSIPMNTIANQWKLTLGRQVRPNPRMLPGCQQRVNTVNSSSKLVTWCAITQAAIDIDIDISILSLQETNVKWTQEIIQGVQSIFAQYTHQSKLIMSSSLNATASIHQPGGTLTATIGKWTLWVWQVSQDPTGMGWWFQIELDGNDGKCLAILTGYWVCPQHLKLGINTAYTPSIKWKFVETKVAYL